MHRKYPCRRMSAAVLLLANFALLGCGVGNSTQVVNDPPPLPAPMITTISPNSAVAGGVPFTLTINGTNFVVGSIVNFDGTARTTTFLSATQLTAAIPAVAIASAGTVAVSVTNPGGSSNAVNFTITSAPNPVPTIQSLDPSSAVAGGAGFTLTVNGTNFVAGSVVNFDGTARTTTFLSATQLTAAIPAATIASAGTVAVSVTNPAPGGSSNAVNFTITSPPAPTITTISPNNVEAGGPAFTLTVNGTNFVAGSIVNFDGTARTTTFLSATQLTADIPASDIAASGSVGVSVTNPAPAGTSNVVDFTITNGPNPVATLQSLDPSSAVAGGAPFTLTVNGTNFVAGAIVNFDGTARTTTFLGATKLYADIPAAAIASAGTVAVSVTNPAPGGSSNAVNFTITSAPNPVPTIQFLSPNGAPPGERAFNLWVYGSNFVAGSVVRWNGSDRPTTVENAVTAYAQIPESDIVATGTSEITVFNPALGGGTSNPSTFNIAAGWSPQSIAVDPNGKFAYVANFGFAEVFVGDVSMYTIDSATGVLTLVGRVAAEHGPSAVAVHPSGKFVHVTSSGDQGGGEDVGDVSTYAIDATTGILTSIGRVFEGLNAPYSVAVDPSGQFAYVPNEGGEAPTRISMYTINSTTGALISIGGVAAGGRALAVTVDPFGKFAYVVNGSNGFPAESDVVSMYTINPTTGALTAIGTIAAGSAPRAIAIDPTAKFAYVANSGSNNVSMYAINATTGALTSLGLVTAGTAPVSLAVGPLGKFAYAANSGSNDVSMYTINATTGALTLMGTVAAGSSPSSIAIHPSGQFAYVTNSGSNDISMYSIDGTSGALTLMGTTGT